MPANGRLRFDFFLAERTGAPVLRFLRLDIRSAKLALARFTVDRFSAKWTFSRFIVGHQLLQSVARLTRTYAMEVRRRLRLDETSFTFSLTRRSPALAAGRAPDLSMSLDWQGFPQGAMRPRRMRVAQRDRLEVAFADHLFAPLASFGRERFNFFDPPIAKALPTAASHKPLQRHELPDRPRLPAHSVSPTLPSKADSYHRVGSQTRRGWGGRSPAEQERCLFELLHSSGSSVPLPAMRFRGGRTSRVASVAKESIMATP